MASAAVHSSLGSDHFGTSADRYGPNVTTLGSAPKTPQYQPRDIVATFNYFKDNEDGSPPAPSYVGKPETYARPTLPQQATVYDVRGSEDKYILDTTGFQFVKHVSEEKDFKDDEHIKAVYYPEIEDILKKATGASRVFIFDHTIRREPSDRTASSIPDPSKPVSLRGPVQRVHIDQSYKAGPQRVTHHLPDEAEKLLKGRYQIINVWRPIKTILKDPLGVAEANSVSDDDLVPIALVYPDRAGETYSVRASPTHKWHYLNQQSPSEVLLIKCFDSKTDGRARRVPHSAFVDEEREEEKARESIEVRVLVFHPDDTE